MANSSTMDVKLLVKTSYQNFLLPANWIFQLYFTKPLLTDSGLQKQKVIEVHIGFKFSFLKEEKIRFYGCDKKEYVLLRDDIVGFLWIKKRSDSEAIISNK